MLADWGQASLDKLCRRRSNLSRLRKGPFTARYPRCSVHCARSYGLPTCHSTDWRISDAQPRAVERPPLNTWPRGKWKPSSRLGWPWEWYLRLRLRVLWDQGDVPRRHRLGRQNLKGSLNLPSCAAAGGVEIRLPAGLSSRTLELAHQ